MLKQAGTEPIEIATDHRCVLGDLTDSLAKDAAKGSRGELLAANAQALLADLLRRPDFASCCQRAYLAFAPQVFEREIQLPIACATDAHLDTRVLLWPVGAADGQHPHCDGWAAFAAVTGDLTTLEERDGPRLPGRAIALREPEVLVPEDGVSHHIHNAGDHVGLTIHIFGT
jgi:hypothetical protein